MTPALAGAALGGVAGLGLLLAGRAVLASRRTSLEGRVLPYVRDLAGTPAVGRPGVAGWLAGLADRLLGGPSGIARRLDRAGLPLTVQELRIEQVLWGSVAFAVMAVPSALVALRSPGRAVPLLLLCAAAFVVGALLRENRLTAQVRARERAILEEFPVIAELLALSVAAGESPSAALERVVGRSHGALSDELGRVLAEVRTGVPITLALDRLAARSGLPVVSRFAEGIAIAVDRGTPLADVLHAQAGDVREAGRRALIESGARREVLMMVPVVFLILPVVVIFAFWPGLVGLRLVVP